MELQKYEVDGVTHTANSFSGLLLIHDGPFKKNEN